MKLTITYMPRCSLLLLALLAGCAQEGDVPVRRLATDTQEIQGGTVDTTSTNVLGIIFNTGQGAGICSGSLIAPNLVLTARHCVGPTNTTQCSTSSFGTPFAAGNFRITTSYNAASNTLNSGVWPNVNNSTWFGAAQIILPSTPANNICGGDIALIRLSSNITNICPLIPRVDVAVGQNEGYTAVGFGRLSPTGQTSGTRYTVSGLNVLCAGNCGFGTDGAREWVGGSSQAKGVCEGDSGGPALDSMRRVLGVVSRGGAGSCSQAVYVGTFGHSAWIRSVALQASQLGGYTAAGWVSGDATSYNECAGALDGGVPVGGGGGSTGGGGGSTGGGGGGTAVDCKDGNICVDATGAGDLTCITPNYTVPAGSASCSGTTPCAVGYSCWQLSSTQNVCLQDCSTPSPGGGPGGGGGTTGGGGGSTGTGGACLVSGTTCINASGQGDYACLGANSSIPASSPRCSATVACPTNYSCWSSTSGAYCLQDCTPGATGGGTGTTGGGSGTTGGGSGTTGGGAGTTGGGTAATGGGNGNTGGGNGSTGGGSANVTPPLFFPAVPKSQPYASGGCSALPESGSALWLMVSGLVVLRRSRRRS